MGEAAKQMGVTPHPSAAAQDKAEAAMNSPPTEADKKAAAAMSK
jgi:hypothetical protein